MDTASGKKLKQPEQLEKEEVSAGIEDERALSMGYPSFPTT